MSVLKWKEQDKLFGLDYSSARANFAGYDIDIRYDCTERKEKPNCGLFLTITFDPSDFSGGRPKDFLVESIEQGKQKALEYLKSERERLTEVLFQLNTLP